MGNLPASSKVNPTPPLAPTNIKVYDALGNPHTVSLVWAKRADNLWKLDIVAADSTLDPVAGTLVGVNDQAMAAANTTANVPAVAQVDTITLPSDGLGLRPVADLYHRLEFRDRDGPGRWLHPRPPSVRP